MLLIRVSMMRTVAPETMADKSLALCRDSAIPHPPDLEEGRPVGMISDCDSLSSTPTLDDPVRASAFARIWTGDEMTRGVSTACPDCPIEDAVTKMHEEKIVYPPVLEGAGDLVDILTSSQTPGRRCICGW